ncbi:bifunctional helix-turn-helix transcriptional regulator/GNAT family N-acetyltransferase [Sphingomonas sp.]|uniref:bifunctional helix-turn-helix transcriptional regulator/GNAT family N-acetyltransferase n=1 Tax=Sphingomonas sp. TaxID=28214 RepID=UPI002C399E78|nr:bifunctional helix-turn-helix transcriptional regulator/GNAT family N-acetyltransferase [Sphingomonas sp.]HWK35352.1 bifunctional helix-turn-helix transcriptional regulator/GNAT family N-acetyltransferase [Sphingomonas sp.]
MADDILSGGYLFLGSRLKRLGERMQADVLRIVEAAGLPIQPSHYPLLALLDRDGAMTVGALASAVGASQPGVTRNLSRLSALGLVTIGRDGRDQRQRSVALSDVGRAAMARSRAEVWPRVEAAAADLCGGGTGSLLAQLGAIEQSLADTPLDRRTVAASGLSIRRWSDDLAGHFHDINAEWIGAMYRIEPADRETLEHPRAAIIDGGGDILFVEAEGLGIVGTCALRHTGAGAFELTKMGVLAAARGRKAGEFLLHAAIRRAGELGAAPLYLLSNTKSAAAIHLYAKAGFIHDAAIMADYGARYARCDVAMRYAGPA